jgi:hypothetical protein
MHNVAHALVTFISTFDNTTVRKYWQTPPVRHGEPAQPGVP